MMKAVILAGGLGMRLRPLTKNIPKPLLPIGESSVLELGILSLREHGVREVYVATYYLSDQIRVFLGDGFKYGIKLYYSTEEKPLGTCGPVTLLKDKLTEPFLLVNGDILTTLDFADLYKYAGTQNALLTVVTKEITYPVRFGKVDSSGASIQGLQEKPEFSMEVLAGIYVLDPKIFEIIPEDTYYGIDDLINELLKQKLKVARYATNAYWLDIGQVDDYLTAQDDYNEHFINLRENYIHSSSQRG